MSKLTMSIDPGVKHAVAVWLDGYLVTAKLLNSIGGQVHTCLEGVEAIQDMVTDFVRPEASLVFDEVVIELPQVYDTAHQKGDQRDLIDLAVKVGALTDALAPYTESVLHVLPSQWKGQTPKKVTTARTKKALTEDELAVVELPTAKGLHHNVWDAIGIGLARWGKLR